MRARVKSIKKGEINLNKFITKKSIYIEKNEIAPLFEEPAKSFSKECGDYIEFSQENQYILPFIENIKMIYILKDEVTNSITKIYKPLVCDKKSKFAEYSIEPANVSILSRVIVTIGSDECFNFSASGQGVDADSNLICKNNGSFSIPIGVSKIINIKYDNSFTYTLPHKNGFRDGKSLQKFPNNRYIMVVDFLSNKMVLSKYIMKKSLNNELFSKISNLLDIEEDKDTDVDRLLKELF